MNEMFLKFEILLIELHVIFAMLSIPSLQYTPFPTLHNIPLPKNFIIFL